MRSDSIVTLAWIPNKNNKNKFVCSRVNDINEMIPEAEGRYVKSNENSADIASRGTSLEKLLQHKLWYQGPLWLQLNTEHWPKDAEEKFAAAPTITEERTFSTIIQKYSDLQKLIRVMAYVIRLKNKLQKKKIAANYLTVDELQLKKKTVIKMQQNLDFYGEIWQLKTDKMMDRKNN